MLESLELAGGYEHLGVQGEAVRPRQRSSATAVTMIAPVTTSYTQLSMPSLVQPLSTTVISSATASVPGIEPLPREGKKPLWRPAPADAQLPPALREVAFTPPAKRTPEPYTTPTDGAWAKPGPVAGPFRAELGDGSVVTYSWYRFCDQPALQHADLSREERERMQSRVELLHRHWTKDRAYLPPATTGKPAALDPAVLVTPPKGMEVGYVPIVTRQELRR